MPAEEADPGTAVRVYGLSPQDRVLLSGAPALAYGFLQISTTGSLVALPFALLLWAILYWGLGRRLRLVTDDVGITICGFYTQRRIPWRDIERFQVDTTRRWPKLQVVTDRTFDIRAVGGLPRGRAAEVADELEARRRSLG